MFALDRRTLLMLAIAAVLGVAAAVGARACSSRPPVHVLLIDAAPATAAPSAAQLAGAVAQPGVYPISSGERLDGLIAAAGGLAAGADASRLNLARHVTDGERIDIPYLAPGAATRAERVRINHASRDELLTLPGVTVSQAAIIASSVRKDGSLGSADDLVRRRLASQPQAAQLQPLVDWAP
ncbi:MAG: SLBB domain-containing protein [Dehalococcoidia bacterium]